MYWNGGITQKIRVCKIAVKHQKFVSPFKVDRLTWIKPSFLWMMYRCGWVQKEGQELIPKDIEESIKLLPRESVYES